LLDLDIAEGMEALNRAAEDIDPDELHRILEEDRDNRDPLG
jgi:hypothetical protein